MKRYIYIFVMLVAALTAKAADATPFHRLTMKIVPDGIATMTVHIDGYYYDAEEQRQRVNYYVNNDTIDIDYQVPAGASINAYCYLRHNGLSDWKPMRLMANGQVMQELNGNPQFGFYMPDEDTDLVVEYDFNPNTPGEPNPNSWNPETGDLIIDLFSAGWPANFNRNEDYPKVKRYILGGRLNNSMYNLVYGLSNMTNLTFFDFSRTDMETLGSSWYNFKDLSLTEVVMPSTVKQINADCFSGTHLQVLSIFALVPPTLSHASHWDSELRQTIDDGQDAFPDCKDMVVRVPAEALPFYQDDADWSQFTLVPMDGNFANLSVKLMPTPNAATIAQYKDMNLELTNVRTGQVRRLLIGSRNEYAFRYLPVNTVYNLVLRSGGGAEVARVDDISVGEEDVSTVFASLKAPHTLKLTVKAGSATADADGYTATWFGSDGSYLLRGNELARRFEGETVKCLVSLNRELAMTYTQPDTLTIAVGAVSDAVTLTLQPLPRTTATITVSDEDSGEGIADATVTVTHLLATGETGSILTLTTDTQGVATGSVVKGLANVTVSHDIYGSKTFNVNFNDSIAFTVPFCQAGGTVINISYTYKPAVAEGQQATVENTYPDEQNMKYRFQYRDSEYSWHYITDYRDQNPRFTFFENLPVGTQLYVYADHTAGKVDQQSRQVTIDESGQASVRFDVVERGAIQCSFRSTDATDVGVLLFNSSSGQLVHRQLFGSKYRVCTLKDLPSNTYQVVMMAQMNQLPNITHRDQLVGLIESQDYLSQTVRVNTGQITLVHHDLIPRPAAQLNSNLAESRAYANSTQVSVGDFVTISATAKFKDDLGATPENLKLTVQLPDGCQLVEKSVMKGQTTTTYQYQSWQRTLTVDWPDMGGDDARIRFCVIPTKTGTIQPDIKVTYTLNGEEHSDMLQANAFSVTAATLFVPEVTTTPTILAQGKAAPSAPVVVLAAGREVAQTTANARGQWQTSFMLPDTTALSRHTITAQITKENVTYQTEARDVTYDPYAIKAKTVTMSFFNYHPVHLEQTDVVFDCETGIATPSSYGFSNESGYNTDFTFSIDLTDNDPEKVYDVALYVYTSGKENGVRGLIAKYNPRKNRWVAYDKFNTECLPYMVNVVPHYRQEPIASRTKLDNVYSNYTTQTTVQADPLVKRFEELVEQEKTAMETTGNVPQAISDEIDSILRELMQRQGLDYDNPGDVDTSNAAFDRLEAESKALHEKYDGLTEGFGEIPLGLNQAGGLLDGVTFGNTNGMTEATLLAQGYEVVNLNDGSKVYARFSPANWSFADLKDNLLMSIDLPDASRPMRDEATSDMEKKYGELQEKLDKFNTALGMIADAADNVLKIVDEGIELFNKCDMKLMDQLAKIRQTGGKYASLANYWNYYKAQALLVENNAAASLLLRCKNILTKFKVGDGVGTLAGLYSYIKDIYDMLKKQREMEAYYYKVPDPCWDDYVRASNLRADIHSFHNHAMTFMITNVAADGLALYSAAAGLAGVGASSGTSILVTLLSIAKIGATYWINEYFDKKFNDNMAYIKAELASLKCKKCDDPEKCCPETAVTNVDGGASGNQPCCIDPGSCPPYPELPPPGPDGPGSNPILDPSGFVYEGVQSNRVEGVTATVYYKETVKDMYGDEHENVVLWDAENYAQQNPQFTDVNGEYGWDVPMGQWQVKYEKTGYETAFSEWLPVPPPQLDVNQNLMQYAQPVVSQVKASQQAVTVGFDKYMKTSTRTTDNIRVTRGGTVLPGIVELLNAETEGKQQLASRVRFVPASPLPVGQTLMLTVGGQVESYAGVALGDDFQQEFDIVQAVEQLVADSLVNVVYNQASTITVSALPAAAAAGKKVSVRLLSSIIAEASATELTLDSNGKATITLSGIMHGTTGLVMQLVDDPDVQTLTVVNVKDESDFITPRPRANYLTGTELYYGTPIELSCDLPDAAIYYTLDGTCPCEQESDKVFRYQRPFILDASTTVKAMAVANGYAESDVKVLSYTVRRDSTDLHLRRGWMWVSHAQSQSVPASRLGGATDKVIDTEGSTVADMQPQTAYKVHSTEAHNALLEGYALNLREAVSDLKEGWNWLPYPMTKALTLDEALAYAQPAEGDVLVGTDGFAIYVNDYWNGYHWEGTLYKLEPGNAYRFKSGKDKLFYLNDHIIKSKAGQQPGLPMFRYYDRYGQPDRMPIVARLMRNNWYVTSNTDDYEVMAFCGDDCRGNGYWRGNGATHLMLNVLGKPGETIRFTVHVKSEDKSYDIVETLPFSDDLQGNPNSPILLTIGQESSGIGITLMGDEQGTTNNEIYDLQGRRINVQGQKGVYLHRGKKIVVK
ncbi:MAG: chitobiase/beta-hexosaminidase C-terminal domain-containing protein [Prevotella sp.]|nr:chitobiase/beta-hexosaminidase C-terminal domain-containing protein [Prevotella sp.]